MRTLGFAGCSWLLRLPCNWSKMIYLHDTHILQYIDDMAMRQSWIRCDRRQSWIRCDRQQSWIRCDRRQSWIRCDRREHEARQLQCWETKKNPNLPEYAVMSMFPTLLDPSRWRHCALSTHQEPLTQWHSIAPGHLTAKGGFTRTVPFPCYAFLLRL
jgi:hypothetical protein